MPENNGLYSSSYAKAVDNYSKLEQSIAALYQRVQDYLTVNPNIQNDDIYLQSVLRLINAAYTQLQKEKNVIEETENKQAVANEENLVGEVTGGEIVPSTPGTYTSPTINNISVTPTTKATVSTTPVTSVSTSTTAPISGAKTSSGAQSTIGTQVKTPVVQQSGLGGMSTQNLQSVVGNLNRATTARKTSTPGMYSNVVSGPANQNRYSQAWQGLWGNRRRSPAGSATITFPITSSSSGTGGISRYLI